MPAGYNKVGIIDGQHRLFCYHEGNDVYETKIALLRKRQHLLVTGIIHPSGLSEIARLQFEAQLFLEINDTQTRAKSALTQEIEKMVRPFSGISVARRVIAELAKRGPYAGKFHLSHFDSVEKIKTSSIVSYGLRPLVKFDGDDSLFFVWNNKEKERLKSPEKKAKVGSEQDADLELLEKYVEFCVKTINDFFVSAKLAFGVSDWNLDSENPSPLLLPTSINGLIICLRRIIAERLPLSTDAHIAKWKNTSTFAFDNYKSSQWNALSEALFNGHYK